MPKPHPEPAPVAADATDATEDRQFVIALARGLSVLQVFGPGDDLLTNAEIAARARLPKATITRLTYTLCKLGYLSREPAGAGYRLDPHILTLGYPVLARLGVREVARPLMQALMDQVGQTVMLGMRDGLHMIFVERVRSPAPVIPDQDLGTRVPLATTSLGRGYLAGLDEAERASVMGELRASSFAADWPGIEAGVAREMARFRAEGYCFGGDWSADINGVAVPVVVPGRSVLSLACAGARAQMPEARLHQIGERLKDIARRILLAQETRL